MMRHRERWIIAAFLVAGLPLSACAASSPEETGDPPAKVQLIEGSDQARVILSEDAARRLGIETTEVQASSSAPGAGTLIIPYAAVLYDPAGDTWTYTNPEPLVFIRQPVQISDIREGQAYLGSGPPAGTQVVTVGASELLGIEYKVGEE